jgi:glycosyltransferase involved in cell wall biosynthesis
VHAVHCGIDTEAFRRDGAQGAEHGERVEVLTVAALEPRKGLDVLLRALDQVPGINLTMVGEGAERGHLEQLVAELGLGPRVRLLGAVGQHRLAELYGAADVFCLPSFAEGVPTVLMEAMSMELPVVATHIMGVPELVEDGRSGLLVPPGRADLLANALARLTADPALRASLAAEARTRVESEFELTSAVTALRRVLDPLIGPAS